MFCLRFPLLLITVLCLIATGGAVRADNPHIVFVLVDDMGYGDAGCYNADSKIPTPNLDDLAAAGMRFTDAHASGPLCHMSRYGLMTGEYPFRTEVNRWKNQPLIDEGQATVASLLAGAGYRTAMVGKWHCGFVEAKKDEDYRGVLAGGPADRGFDSFFGIRASTDIPPYFYIAGDRAVQPPSDRIEARDSVDQGWTPIQGEFWREGGIAPGLELPEVLPRFTDEALAVIDGHSGDQPLMLYLAYPAPHTPWLPSEDFAGRSKASMYGDFVAMVDAEIGRVLEGLKKAGMADDTLVIFSSDNGPVWYKEDIERFQHDAVGGLRGMKADAWEGGHRMPFIVRWPGSVAAGSVSDQTISFVDVMATFADLVGVELPEQAGPDSFSFLSALKGDPAGEKQPQRESLVMKSGRGVMTFRRGPWKYINDLGSGGFSQPSKEKPEPGGPQGQLYHLGDDPGETRNLWAEKPDLVAELKAEMNRIKGAGRSR